jgi:hypothetical protein
MIGVILRGAAAGELSKVAMPNMPARGSSATRRAAVAAGVACAGRSAVTEEMMGVSLAMADSLGKRVNVAASSQGSIFCRANADRTLNGISSSNSPMGAYRNGSNSEPRAGIPVARFAFGRGSGSNGEFMVDFAPATRSNDSDYASDESCCLFAGALSHRT